MRERGTTDTSRHIAAFIAAGFFYLAGTICIAGALFPRHAAIVILGTMFLCLGSLWMVIGAKYKAQLGGSNR